MKSYSDERTEEYESKFTFGLALVFVVSFLLYGIYCFLRARAGFDLDAGGRLGICLNVLIWAIALYFIKKSKYQLWYGLAEVGVALGVAWFALDKFSLLKTSFDFEKASYIFVCIYLIRRGVDNVAEGLPKQRKYDIFSERDKWGP